MGVLPVAKSPTVFLSAPSGLDSFFVRAMCAVLDGKTGGVLSDLEFSGKHKRGFKLLEIADKYLSDFLRQRRRHYASAGLRFLGDPALRLALPAALLLWEIPPRLSASVGISCACKNISTSRVKQFVDAYIVYRCNTSINVFTMDNFCNSQNSILLLPHYQHLPTRITISFRCTARSRNRRTSAFRNCCASMHNECKTTV